MNKMAINNEIVSLTNNNYQQRLLDSIWDNDIAMTASHGFDAQGINIYRRNLLANAQRALSISFPTLFELLDSNVSTHLSTHFLPASSPLQGDWAQWGQDFPEFIEGSELGKDYLYLADCARLDWHVHSALQGKDQVLDQASLQLLSDAELEHVFIHFNDNVKLLSSPYPLVDIFDAHHHQDETRRKAALNSAKQALSSTLVDHYVMIFRPEFEPCIRNLSIAEGNFMRTLMAKKSLAEALDSVINNPEFSFENWLMSAINNNLIHYLKESKS